MGQAKVPRPQQLRLVAFDVDGTLMRVDGTISQTVEAAIRRARAAGLEVTLATGRRYSGFVAETARRLGLKAPLVTLNGSEVRWPDGRILVQHALSAEDARFLFELAKTYGARFWAVNTAQEVHDETTMDHPDAGVWLKFGYWAPEEAVIQQVWAALEAHGGLELTNSHPHNIEVNPAGVTKASGLAVVCRELGLSSQQVAAVGDSLNDVAMIRWAGLGIAMGNAQPAVKAVADTVTRSVDEDGAANVIEQILRGFQ
jgi:HAD superfamily hydrolase (TIGR01484 family)